MFLLSVQVESSKSFGAPTPNDSCDQEEERCLSKPTKAANTYWGQTTRGKRALIHCGYRYLLVKQLKSSSVSLWRCEKYSSCPATINATCQNDRPIVTRQPYVNKDHNHNGDWGSIQVKDIQADIKRMSQQKPRRNPADIYQHVVADQRLDVRSEVLAKMPKKDSSKKCIRRYQVSGYQVVE